MSIYLRTITDGYGDAVDYMWFCSASCYDTSLASDPPTSELLVNPADDPNATREGIEVGGRYPCGAEHDSPDYCAVCGDPIGNPLTTEGECQVIAYVRDVESGAIPHYDNDTSRARVNALRQEYGYLWHPIDGAPIHDVEDM